MKARNIIETGFWCHTEGLYFTDEKEHDSTPVEERFFGPIGHFGYLCRTEDDQPSTHTRVAVVEFRWRRPR